MQDYKKHRIYFFLFLLTITSRFGFQSWRTLYNNYIVDIIGLNGLQNGAIQSIREIPGFLALLVIYLLFLFKEHRLAAFSVLIMGAGISITGMLPSFSGIIFTTLIMSFGFHYFETLNQSLTLQYYGTREAPLVFGSLRAAGSMANISTGIILLFITAILTYKQMFLIVGIIVIAVSLYCFRLDPVDKNLPLQNQKMVFRRKYWLFYVLTFLAGARRQIFVTFAVFLLVKRFGFSIQLITGLFLINNFINYFLSPIIAKAIVRFGERKVLSLEYGSLIFIFLGYAYTKSAIVIAILYILDHIFFNFSIAIKTYFQKIADPMDISPSMAVGFTINHIAAVVIPVCGGLIWMIDYRLPFYFGIGFTIISFIMIQKIKVIPKKN